MLGTYVLRNAPVRRFENEPIIIGRKSFPSTGVCSYHAGRAEQSKYSKTADSKRKTKYAKASDLRTTTIRVPRYGNVATC